MSAVQVRPTYARVLQVPGARSTFALALIGRLSYGLIFLSLLLTITRSTGSYSIAGAVLALFGLTSSVLSPLRARLLDRRGVWPALPVMAGGYALLLLAIAAGPGNRVALCLLGAAAGACTPALGPLMRALWGELIPDPGLLQRAYSLDTVAEETLYVVGPLLVGLLTALAAPALGLVASAVLVFVGALGLALSPAVRHRPARNEPGGLPRSGLSLWPARDTGLRTAMALAVGLGGALGALSLLTVAFAQAHHHLAAVAWVEAALAVGSIVGGLAYGAKTWRSGLAVRLPILVALLAVSVGLSGLASNLAVLVLGVGVSGLFVSPALTSAYLLADLGAPRNARAEAGAWVNTGFNLGNSAGTAAIAPVISLVPLPLAFALAAAVVLIPLAATSTAQLSRRSGS